MSSSPGLSMRTGSQHHQNLQPLPFLEAPLQTHPVISTLWNSSCERTILRELPQLNVYKVFINVLVTVQTQQQVVFMLPPGRVTEAKPPGKFHTVIGPSSFRTSLSLNSARRTLTSPEISSPHALSY